ncbi:protein FAR1-RELATED SEQUENCE 5-like [Curcuma longa]|uniref:protein FAR1-RELATED SEQUENCE 5-like n=1 Tax=Curcuma longa TaxID=136217 RepID=UPI003D9E5E99
MEDASDSVEQISVEKPFEIDEEIEKEKIEEPKIGMLFDSYDEAYLYYSRYAKQEGFAIVKKSFTNGADGKLKYACLSCNRGGKAKVTSNPVKPRPQIRIGCPARVNVGLGHDGKWRLNQTILTHNHGQSPSKVKYLKCNRIIDEHTKKRLQLNDAAGINLNKSYDALQIEAGGPSSLSFSQKDCRNYLDRHRRSLLVEGDAEAMYKYFIKMGKDNSDFFHAMDMDDEGRLRNVFWADARSRAAAKEFGDVVTFDTTYLVNRYDMPFAPFVGVNHHGQSILLGCGLISHEDTESFLWLFETWKTCMWDCPPNAIITDQCMAMKSAIEKVFPLARHRWCIWHIMKKIPEKLSRYKAREKICGCMRRIVYNSLTANEFENAWHAFIQEYSLQSNTWLDGLYAERRRWVPAYLKDIFWAGMSSTQRSESMNAYFDGYIHSKTTLKQFVGQYENALAKKVEVEHQEDVKSWHSFIPLIQEADELEKQFQSVYTNNKVREFQKEFVGKLNCLCSKIMEEFEVKELIMFGEGEEKVKKEVAYNVRFHAETNETYCTCQLFEFKGMVCRHQLLVWYHMRIQKVPDKYVLRRWCKNIKRAYSKIPISYDKSSRGIEAQRRENMCNLFKEVADLAEESVEKYNLVMIRGRQLRQELLIDSLGPDILGSKTPDGSFSLEADLTSTQGSANILDPKVVKRKGRPRCNRIQGSVEKIIRKNKEKKQMAVLNKKTKESQDNIFNSQTQSSYVGLSMCSNIMPHSDALNEDYDVNTQSAGGFSNGQSADGFSTFGGTCGHASELFTQMRK